MFDSTIDIIEIHAHLITCHFTEHNINIQESIIFKKKSYQPSPLRAPGKGNVN